MIYFQTVTATPVDAARLEWLRRDTERYTLGDDVLYLHAPDGIGRSKLASGVKRVLGVPVTARNWRSVMGTPALARMLPGDA